MHTPGLKRLSGRFYWLISPIVLQRRNIQASVTKTQTFLRLYSAALILSRSLNSKSNVTVKLSFKLVLKLVHFMYNFLVSLRSIIPFRAAVSPHKSARSIKEEMSKTLLPNTFICSLATKQFVRHNRMQHSPPQGILILWRFTHSCSFQRFASDNDNTNCAEVTRLSVLSCNVIGQGKKTKAVTSQK